MSRTYQNICVISSYKKTQGEICVAATHFGRALGENYYNLIYGGGDGGLMGTIMNEYWEGIQTYNEKHNIAEKIKDINFNFDLMPVKAISTEWYRYCVVGDSKHRGFQNKITVKDLHDRKREMIKHADALVAFPGGIQMLSELADFMGDNGYRKSQYRTDKMKPIICVEPKGTEFEWLRTFLKYSIDDKFTDSENYNMFDFVPYGGMAVQKLEELNSQSPKLLSELLPQPQI